MIDLYIKSPTLADLVSALPAWMKTSTNVPIPYAEGYAMDFIGEVVSGGSVDTAYHANLRLLDESLQEEVESALQAYLISKPQNPAREWAK